MPIKRLQWNFLHR